MNGSVKKEERAREGAGLTDMENGEVDHSFKSSVASLGRTYVDVLRAQVSFSGMIVALVLRDHQNGRMCEKDRWLYNMKNVVAAKAAGKRSNLSPNNAMVWRACDRDGVEHEETLDGGMVCTTHGRVVKRAQEISGRGVWT